MLQNVQEQGMDTIELLAGHATKAVTDIRELKRTILTDENQEISAEHHHHDQDAAAHGEGERGYQQRLGRPRDAAEPQAPHPVPQQAGG